MPDNIFDLFVRRLRRVTAIRPDDEPHLRALPFQVQEFGPNETIVDDGSLTHCSCLILDGFTMRSKITIEGKRQILAFHIAGDIPDLHSLHLEKMDHNLVSLTRSKVAFIRHSALNALCVARPNVAAAFWRETLIDAATFRAWITSIGRTSGAARVAHLLCETFTRLEAVGLAGKGEGRLPFTQEQIGDAVGLSIVHVNRIMQGFRFDGLIETDNRNLRIRDWNALAEIGQFDPAYLHLERPQDEKSRS